MKDKFCGMEMWLQIFDFIGPFIIYTARLNGATVTDTCSLSDVH